MAFKTQRITVNEVTPTKLATGPCRVHLRAGLISGTGSPGTVVLGENDVTALTGYEWPVDNEIGLSSGERIFGIAGVGSGTFDVQVMTNGSP